MLDAGAEEVTDRGESFEVMTEAVRPGRRAHRAAGGRHRLRLGRRRSSSPTVKVEVDAETARKVFRLIDALEDSDDVQNVYTNFDITRRGAGRSSTTTTSRTRAVTIRVLGIDPGLTRCGVGVVDVRRRPPRDARRRGRRSARRPTCRSSSGCSPSATGSRSCSTRTGPAVVAIERVFAQHNLRTVMGTAQVSGVALHAAAEARPARRPAHARAR